MSKLIKELNSKLVHEGKRALVVGGTAGIGKGIAKRLASAGFDVTIAGRNEASAKQVVEECKQLGKGNHSYILCDGQYVKTGLEFGKNVSKLDVLILTQGIATLQGRTETSEGIDQKMALHYYGRVGFILGLLPLLRSSTSPSVLSVLSAGVHSEYKEYLSDPQLKENYSLSNCANAAGFYNDLALDQLSQENSQIHFSHAAPGVVNTNWGTEFPFVLRMLLKPFKPFLRSADDCAEYLLQGILQSHKPGFFLIDQYGSPAKKVASHDIAKEYIWNDTMNVMKSCGWK
jgi:NAD(P)-dependent dehydrogenase (short-subunit alcohol dehydrogenase family)